MDNPTEQPVKYAAYPRGTKPYGSAEHLQAVAEVYFGLNTAGLVAFMCGLTWPLLGEAIGPLNMPFTAFCVVLASTATGLIAYGSFRKLATIREWSLLTPILLAILVSLFSPFCIGFFVIALAQSWPTQQLRKYRLGTGFKGVNRKDVAQKVREMQEAVAVVHLLDYGISSLPPQEGELADINSPNVDPTLRPQ